MEYADCYPALNHAQILQQVGTGERPPGSLLGAVLHFGDDLAAGEPHLEPQDLQHQLACISNSCRCRSYFARIRISSKSYRFRSIRSPSTKRWFLGNFPVWLHDHNIRSYAFVRTVSSSVRLGSPMEPFVQVYICSETRFVFRPFGRGNAVKNSRSKRPRRTEPDVDDTVRRSEPAADGGTHVRRMSHERAATKDTANCTCDH